MFRDSYCTRYSFSHPTRLICIRPFTNIAVAIETERNAPAEFLWPVLQPSVTMTLLSDCTKIQPIKCSNSRTTCFIHKFWGFSHFKPAASYSLNDSCTPEAIFTPKMFLLRTTCTCIGESERCHHYIYIYIYSQAIKNQIPWSWVHFIFSFQYHPMI